MKFKVITVYANSDHPMAGRVEDEYDLFVENEVGNFYPASEFFYMTSVKEFESK